MANILEGLPATERRLDEIRLHQQDDEVCRKLQFSTEGWPDKSKLNSALKAFWPERANPNPNPNVPERSPDERLKTYHSFISSFGHFG